MQTILFVSHEASRTGAPASLLAVVRALVAQGTRCEVLILHDGPLTAAFEAVCPTTVLWGAHLPPISVHRLMHQYSLKAIQAVQHLPHWLSGRLRLKHTIARIRRHPPSLIYLNSTVCASVIHQIHRVGSPIVSHIHELSWGIANSGHPLNIGYMFNVSKHLIVPADCVARHVQEVYGVDRDRITVIPEAVNDPFVTVDASSMRASLNIPASSCVITMAGEISWRKGIDLFIALGRMLASRSDAHFLWIGGGRDYQKFIETWQSFYGIDDALAARFHFAGEQSSIASLLNITDVFALTSREDPLPLVHIEAAMLRKPIVCFSASGGAPEWIGDAGVVVPYQDVAAMADAIVELAGDPDRRNRMGKIGRAMMMQYCLPERVASQVQEVMNAACR